jgi:hypothetical protein
VVTKEGNVNAYDDGHHQQPVENSSKI